MEAVAAKRVCLTGSESTGKTVLAQELAALFGAPWSPEYARSYAEAKGVLTAADVEPIAFGQIGAEWAHECPKCALHLRDTDLVSTVVYARAYYGSCPEWIETAARERLADLYLLLDIDVPWTADPARDRPDDREAMQQRFRETLEELGARVVDVRGTWEERRERAIAAINALLDQAAT